MLDIKTGMLVWCSQGLTLTIFLYLLWRQDRASRFYLMWCLGFALATVGFGLTLGRDYLPLFVAVGLGHATALSGYPLWVGGFCLLENRKFPWAAVLPPAIWICGMALPWVTNDMLNRVALFHLANAVGAAMIVGALSGAAGRREAAARQLAAVFAAICVFSFSVALAIGVGHFASRDAGLVGAIAAFGNGVLQLFAIALSIRLVTLRSEQRWRALSVTDPVVGVLNRRGVQEAFAELKADGGDRKLAALLFDLDRFKMINDRFGHQAGDDALISFGRTAQRHILPDTAFGRVGGEEFAAFFLVRDEAEAETVAETIRIQTCRLPVRTRTALVPVSVSVGVAVMAADVADWDRLFSAADRALYAAKRGGRNRTVVFDQNLTAAMDEPAAEVDEQVEALRRITVLSRR